MKFAKKKEYTWIHFQDIHTFTYQKRLLHTLLCLFLKSSKVLGKQHPFNRLFWLVSSCKLLRDIALTMASRRNICKLSTTCHTSLFEHHKVITIILQVIEKCFKKGCIDCRTYLRWWFDLLRDKLNALHSASHVT